MSKIIHRWQMTGRTTCGIKITDRINVNLGHRLDDGVTCERCRQALTRMSYLGEEWNGQCDGHPRAEAPLTTGAG